MRKIGLLLVLPDKKRFLKDERREVLWRDTYESRESGGPRERVPALYFPG